LSEGCINKLYDPTLDAYFKQPFGVINGDLLAYKHGKPLWWRTQVATRHPAAIEHLDQTLNFVLKSNLMFFPDPVRGQQ